MQPHTWSKPADQKELKSQAIAGFRTAVGQVTQLHHHLALQKRKDKIVVKGKRRVWGTHKMTTTRAVKNAINSIANTGGIEVQALSQILWPTQVLHPQGLTNKLQLGKVLQ